MLISDWSSNVLSSDLCFIRPPYVPLRCMKLHHQCTTRAIFSGSGGCGMRAVLTQAMIEKMPLPAKRKDCRDTRLKGLILRVSPNGVKSFYCEYARGKRVWLGRADALGMADARESARAIERKSTR